MLLYVIICWYTFSCCFMLLYGPTRFYNCYLGCRLQLSFIYLNYQLGFISWALSAELSLTFCNWALSAGIYLSSITTVAAMVESWYAVLEYVYSVSGLVCYINQVFCIPGIYSILFLGWARSATNQHCDRGNRRRWSTNTGRFKWFPSRKTNYQKGW